MSGVSFVRLTPADLEYSAIVPQALDNQWVPTTVLKRLIKRGIPLRDWQSEDESKKLVLSEWRRALIYTPQVVVNRAALFNNAIIVEDYSGEGRPHFQKLLSNRVIVEYLLTEESPDQRPAFTIGEEKWRRWLDTIKDAEMACVRLDWGNQEDDFRHVAEVFHAYFQTVNMPDRIQHLTSAFRIPSGQKRQFEEKLKEVARLAFDVADQGKRITRNELYKRFVCRDGSPIDEGWYDSSKPFAAELKQLFDLRYTVNLPDALGRYAFTPKDSPDRTVLGELTQETLQNALRDNQIEQLWDQLRHFVFAMVIPGLYIKGLHLLSLQDVLEIRRTDEWENYIKSLNELLRHPLEFETRANRLVEDFATLSRRIVELKARREKATSTAIAATAQVGMQLVLAVGSAWMKFSFSPEDPSRILVETLAAPVAAGVAPFALNLFIKAQGRLELAHSVNFLRSRVRNGRDVWREITGRLSSDPRFQFAERQGTLEQEANQSGSEINPEDYLG